MIAAGGKGTRIARLNSSVPKPRLLLEAAEQYNMDLAASWLTDDSERDMEAGIAAGCQVMKISKDFGLLEAVREIGL